MAEESTAVAVAEEQEGGLKRGFKKLHVQMVALGGVIGSAYFYGVGGFIEMTGPGAFLAFALGGVMVFCTLYCLGELLVAMPVTGSFIAYAREFIGDGMGAGVGWTYWAAIIVYIPSECLVIGMILNMYIPALPSFVGAIIGCIVITILNLSQVGNLGKVESILAITKVMAICVFMILALLIALGVIGVNEAPGMDNMLGQGGLLPLGAMAIFANLAIIVMNFAGVEIIALTAGETPNPAKVMPSAVRMGFIRVIVLFLIPTFLVAVIMPWTMCNYDSSAFAQALTYNGFPILGHIFNLVIIVAALSCANCNMYGAIRDMYAMANENMAPKFLGKATEKGVPRNAAAVSMVVVWIILFAYQLDTSGSFYGFLLSCSGIATIFCWLSICLCQMIFRRRITKAGLTKKNLRFATPGSPIPAVIGVCLMVATFFLTLFSDDPNACTYGLGVFLIAFIIFQVRSKKGTFKQEKEINWEETLAEIKDPHYLDGFTKEDKKAEKAAAKAAKKANKVS